MSKRWCLFSIGRNLLSICVKCGKSFNDGTNSCPDDGGQVIPKLLHTETKASTNPQTGNLNQRSIIFFQKETLNGLILV